MSRNFYPAVFAIGLGVWTGAYSKTSRVGRETRESNSGLTPFSEQDTTPSSLHCERYRMKRAVLFPRGMCISTVWVFWKAQSADRNVLSRNQTPPAQSETPSNTVVNDPKGPGK